MGFFDRLRDRLRRREEPRPYDADYAPREYFREDVRRRPWYRSNWLPLLLLPLLLIPLLFFAATQLQQNRSEGENTNQVAQQTGDNNGTEVGIGGAPNVTPTVTTAPKNSTATPTPRTTAQGTGGTTVQDESDNLVSPITDEQRVDKYGEAAQGIGGSGYTPNSVPSTGRGR